MSNSDGSRAWHITLPRVGVIDIFFSMPLQQQPENELFGFTIRTDLAAVVELMIHRNPDLLAGFPEDLSLLLPYHDSPTASAATASIVAVFLLIPQLVPMPSEIQPRTTGWEFWPLALLAEPCIGSTKAGMIGMPPKCCVPSVAARIHAKVLVEIALGWMRSSYHQPQRGADIRESRHLVSLILAQSQQAETWEGLDMGFDTASFATIHWTAVWWKRDRCDGLGESQHPLPQPCRLKYPYIPNSSDSKQGILLDFEFSEPPGWLDMIDFRVTIKFLDKENNAIEEASGQLINVSGNTNPDRIALFIMSDKATADISLQNPKDRNRGGVVLQLSEGTTKLKVEVDDPNNKEDYKFLISAALG
ncbi:hypothetical protein MFIFM68171_07019 [Madurella fahalii]|uniref:Uncharacterized protein n=1 Tax=Madurella fahalii TaxID=1157608 RepID=A0ABQ0GGC1_9PEZI